MSYLSFIPEDPVGSEHMTMVWAGKRWDGPAYEYEMESTKKVMDTYCPFVGVVYGTDIFMDKPAFLIAVPHIIHLFRAQLQFYDMSERESTNWTPHITVVGGHVRDLGEKITFVEGAWRP